MANIFKPLQKKNFRKRVACVIYKIGASKVQVNMKTNVLAAEDVA